MVRCACRRPSRPDPVHCGIPARLLRRRNCCCRDLSRAVGRSSVSVVLRPRLKLIFWDGTGLCLFAKRLEDGIFRWPKIEDGVMRLSAAQLSALLEGLDWRRVPKFKCVQRFCIPGEPLFHANTNNEYHRGRSLLRHVRYRCCPRHVSLPRQSIPRLERPSP